MIEDKYILGYSGLTYYDERIKDYIDNTVQEVIGGKQDKLIPGPGIEIDSANTITVISSAVTEIDDAITSSTKTWSSYKINSELDNKSNTGHTHSISELDDDIGLVTSEQITDISGTSIYLTIRVPVSDKTSDTGTTFDIEPNVMYMFGDRTTLTINLLPGETGIVNEYMFQFTSGSVATTLNVPNTVVWLKEPDIQTNKKYSISIENNLGVIGEWDNE